MEFTWWQELINLLTIPPSCYISSPVLHTHMDGWVKGKGIREDRDVLPGLFWLSKGKPRLTGGLRSIDQSGSCCHRLWHWQSQTPSQAMRRRKCWFISRGCIDYLTNVFYHHGHGLFLGGRRGGTCVFLTSCVTHLLWVWRETKFQSSARPIHFINDIDFDLKY